MRKYFVTGFYLLIIGGILLLGGVLMGANRSVVWNHGFKVAQSVDETYPLSDFKNVYVEGRDTNVNFKLGDRYKIHVDGDKSQMPSYKVRNDTLTITGKKKNKHVGVDVLGRTKVTITIPMDKTLDNVSLRLANSAIYINDVTIEHLVKTAKDMDYDAQLYIKNATINNLDKINLYDANFEVENSKISNMTLVANQYSDVIIKNSTLVKTSVNLNESALKVKQSNLDTMNSLSNHGRITMDKVVFMNKNDFRIFSDGHFTGSDITADGSDLTTADGVVRVMDKDYGHEYQNKVDASTLLTVKATKGSITIK
ncbi:DUF4097 family beta strand repeat-containing protein [Companilactobacillus farciminis]|uniref:DUF4097 family beta strand repeat-containing protein n=1 Tax=Companilactobacillus farciminis TaxID=1612 RepID=UPI00232C293B|nr:DUF4097 family beta strand repeat-containing protein [Companilactobacillus farciminis]WCG35238.1 DUF4097 family beta strand repeat-containing protein [Companilactobacillus farciminis]